MTSAGFTKLFIKNFVINGIFVGIVLGIIYAIGKAFLPNIATVILGYALIFLGIIKIYLSAIDDAFYEGKIYQEDIHKISRNIIIIFVVIFLINTIINFAPYVKYLNLIKMLGLESIIIRNLVVNFVIYTIIAISCRIKFLKECNNPDNVIMQ